MLRTMRLVAEHLIAVTGAVLRGLCKMALLCDVLLFFPGVLFSMILLSPCGTGSIPGFRGKPTA